MGIIALYGVLTLVALPALLRFYLVTWQERPSTQKRNRQWAERRYATYWKPLLLKWQQERRFHS